MLLEVFYYLLSSSSSTWAIQRHTAQPTSNLINCISFGSRG